jgi:hypothetical protein
LELSYIEIVINPAAIVFPDRSGSPMAQKLLRSRKLDSWQIIIYPNFRDAKSSLKKPIIILIRPFKRLCGLTMAGDN